MLEITLESLKVIIIDLYKTNKNRDVCEMLISKLQQGKILNIKHQNNITFFFFKNSKF